MTAIEDNGANFKRDEAELIAAQLQAASEIILTVQRDYASTCGEANRLESEVDRYRKVCDGQHEQLQRYEREMESLRGHLAAVRREHDKLKNEAEGRAWQRIKNSRGPS